MRSNPKIIATIVVTGGIMLSMLLAYHWLSIDANSVWLVAVVGGVLVAVLGASSGHSTLTQIRSAAGDVMFASRPGERADADQTVAKDVSSTPSKPRHSRSAVKANRYGRSGRRKRPDTSPALPRRNNRRPKV